MGRESCEATINDKNNDLCPHRKATDKGAHGELLRVLAQSWRVYKESSSYAYDRNSNLFYALQVNDEILR